MMHHASPALLQGVPHPQVDVPVSRSQQNHKRDRGVRIWNLLSICQPTMMHLVPYPDTAIALVILLGARNGDVDLRMRHTLKEGRRIMMHHRSLSNAYSATIKSSGTIAGS